MDFTATSNREVEELRDQLKEPRQLLELRSDRSRETGEPSKWAGKGINSKTDMPMPIWDEKEHPKDPESFIREFETYIKLINGGADISPYIAMELLKIACPDDSLVGIRMRDTCRRRATSRSRTGRTTPLAMSNSFRLSGTQQ